jgi:hypothetical protein
MANQKLVVGLNLSSNHSDSKIPCIGCTVGKIHQSSLPQGRTRGTHIGSLIHSDVCGPITPPTPAGSRYFVTFKDDYWAVVHFFKNKDEVPDLFLPIQSTSRTQNQEESSKRYAATTEASTPIKISPHGSEIQASAMKLLYHTLLPKMEWQRELTELL